MSARTIVIPSCEQHAGQDAITVTLPWACIHCGGPRGEPQPALSFDGSLRLSVHGWDNPCGHTETYAELRAWLARRASPHPPAPAITEADVPY